MSEHNRDVQPTATIDRSAERVRLRLVGSVVAGARLTDTFEEEGFVVEWTAGGVEPQDARPDGTFELDFVVSTPIDSRSGESRRVRPGTTIDEVLRRHQRLNPRADISVVR